VNASSSQINDLIANNYISLVNDRLGIFPYAYSLKKIRMKFNSHVSLTGANRSR